MPICGRTPRECFNAFSQHMRELVAATVTTTYPLIDLPTDRKMMLSFRQECPIAVPVETAHGRLFFYLGQSLEAVPEPELGFRLATKQYWYRIQLAPDLRSDSAMRWEYDAATAENRHPRHHTQVAASIPLGASALDLNKAHLPTGWVTIEEVIRFLIVDLGMNPPCGDWWPEKLAESERKFYEDYTSKRYKGPSSSED